MTKTTTLLIAAIMGMAASGMSQGLECQDMYTDPPTVKCRVQGAESGWENGFSISYQVTGHYYNTVFFDAPCYSLTQPYQFAPPVYIGKYMNDPCVEYVTPPALVCGREFIFTAYPQGGGIPSNSVYLTLTCPDEAGD